MRNQINWAFLLGSPDIGGGTYVIFEHAIHCTRAGDKVTIITEEPVSMDQLNWHPEAKALDFKTYSEIKDTIYDVVFATWWETVFKLYRVKAKKYAYFVQSIESQFYPEENVNLRNLVDDTYRVPLDIITEAKWIKTHLEEKYNRSVQLVPNGIRKDIYTRDGEAHAEKNNNKLRVLVEGPLDVWLKNVEKTIRLCRKSNADEVWLLTSTDTKSVKGIDRTFSRIPIFETPKVYRSCDVIVKLSYVEGMFGPPLEMFHCGGTSITYDVTGYDEYIVSDKNGMVIKTDDDDKVVAAINKLKADSEYLLELKKQAKITAEEWPAWEKSSTIFRNAVYKIIDQNSPVEYSTVFAQLSDSFNLYIKKENERIGIKERAKLILRYYLIEIPKTIIMKFSPNAILLLKKIKNKLI